MGLPSKGSFPRGGRAPAGVPPGPDSARACSCGPRRRGGPIGRSPPAAPSSGNGLLRVRERAADRLAEPRVRFDLPPVDLPEHPAPQLLHQRPAVLLVKPEPLLRRHALRRLVVPVHRREALEHVAALLREARHHLHELPPRVRKAVRKHDPELLRHVPRHRVRHLDRSLEPRGPPGPGPPTDRGAEDTWASARRMDEGGWKELERKPVRGLSAASLKPEQASRRNRPCEGSGTGLVRAFIRICREGPECTGSPVGLTPHSRSATGPEPACDLDEGTKALSFRRTARTCAVRCCLPSRAGGISGGSGGGRVRQGAVGCDKGRCRGRGGGLAPSRNSRFRPPPRADRIARDAGPLPPAKPPRRPARSPRRR